MVEFLQNFNMLIFIIITLAYLYQMVYVVVGFVNRKKRDSYEPKKYHKFAAIISARNEQNVIGELIGDLKKQNYPEGLFDVIVVADNCTDSTAQISSEAGAIVFERSNKVKVGKGYALDFLFKKIKEELPQAGYEGYIIFDADNRVDCNFVREMNKVFDKGYKAVTCYRNSKNYGTNWITAGYSLWFLREARYLNSPRMKLGANCAVSGTGFLISNELVEKNGGWPYHLLTEDIEFSIDCAIKGELVGYCEGARLYDEQPVTFTQSYHQRLRWSKGFLQVVRGYGVKLLCGIFKKRGGDFSCYDMLMTVAPAIMLTVFAFAVNLGVMIYSYSIPLIYLHRIVNGIAAGALVTSIVNMYLCFFFVGLLTTITEWKEIDASAGKKLLYTLSFPVFLATYLPITFAALFKKVEWKPIAHGVTDARQVKTKA